MTATARPNILSGRKWFKVTDFNLRMRQRRNTKLSPNDSLVTAAVARPDILSGRKWFKVTDFDLRMRQRRSSKLSPNDSLVTAAACPDILSGRKVSDFNLRMRQRLSPICPPMIVWGQLQLVPTICRGGNGLKSPTLI